MSTTVYGCVNSNGSITFNLSADEYDCMIQDACIVMNGEHIGQVALTLSDADNEDCNDTFYGCVDPSTGKFEIELPDICCDVIGNDCVSCNPGETPKYITIIISGVEDCKPDECIHVGYEYHKYPAPVVNGTFLLTQNPVDSCSWYIHIPYQVKIYSDYQCENLVDTDSTYATVSVTRAADHASANAANNSCDYEPTECVNGSCIDVDNDCDSQLPPWGGSSVSFTVIEGI